MVLGGNLLHGIKIMVPETKRPGFKSEGYHLLAVRLGERYITSVPQFPHF